MGTKSSNITEKSEFSRAQLAVDFVKAFEAEGATPRDINNVKENKELIRAILGVEHGTHKFLSRKFPVWETLEIGGSSKESMITDIENSDFIHITPYAQKVVEHQDFSVLPDKSTFNVVRTFVENLGFSSSTMLYEIINRVKEEDGICPDEIGLRILKKFPNRPIPEDKGIFLGGELIITEPFSFGFGDELCLSMLAIIYDQHNRYLESWKVELDSKIKPNMPIIFVSQD